jgi:hypothetical protein
MKYFAIERKYFQTFGVDCFHPLTTPASSPKVAVLFLPAVQGPHLRIRDEASEWRHIKSIIDSGTEFLHT